MVHRSLRKVLAIIVIFISETEVKEIFYRIAHLFCSVMVRVE